MTGAARAEPPTGSPSAQRLAEARAAAAAADPTWTRTAPDGAWRVVVTPPAPKVVRATVAVHVPADTPAPGFLDVCDLARESARRKLEAWAAGQLAADAVPALAGALRALAGQLASRPRDGSEDGGERERFTLATPEPWPDSVDGATVLDDVATFIAAHVVLPPHAADVCALWVAHAYVFDVWPVTPYLLVVSPTRACGKTTLVDVLAALAPRALSASDTTPAALFRLTEKWHPTLFLDEVDAWLTAKREDGLINLLNAGARAGGRAVRCVGEGASLDVAGFDVFCPKLLAGIVAPLPDATRSRTIALRLERATPAQLAALRPFSAHDAPTATPLSSRLARWTADARDAGSGLPRRVTALPDGISGRDADLWTPLVALADAAGGRWPAAARAAAVAFVGAAARDEVRDLAEAALRDAREYCGAHPAPLGTLVPSAGLLEWMKADELRPWATLGRDGLTAKRLGDYLRRFGVHATQGREDGEKIRGYSRAAILDAAARYSPDALEHSAVDENVGHAGQPGQAGQADAAAAPIDSAPVPHVSRVPHVPHVPFRGTEENVLPIVGGGGRRLGIFGEDAA